MLTLNSETYWGILHKSTYSLLSVTLVLVILYDQLILYLFPSFKSCFTIMKPYGFCYHEFSAKWSNMAFAPVKPTQSVNRFKYVFSND